MPNKLYVKNLKTKRKSDGFHIQKYQEFKIHKRTAKVFWEDLTEIGFNEEARIETQYGFSPDRKVLFFIHTQKGTFRKELDDTFTLDSKKPKVWGHKVCNKMFLNFKRDKKHLYMTLKDLDKMVKGLKSSSSWILV